MKYKDRFYDVIKLLFQLFEKNILDLQPAFTS